MAYQNWTPNMKNLNKSIASSGAESIKKNLPSKKSTNPDMFVVVGIEFRALHMLYRCSTTIILKTKTKAKKLTPMVLRLHHKVERERIELER